MTKMESIETRARRVVDNNGRMRWQAQYRITRRTWTTVADRDGRWLRFHGCQAAHAGARYHAAKQGD